jgi:ribonuclease P protein component
MKNRRLVVGSITVWIDPEGQGRLGITVPRSVGGAAERNVAKRRVREVCREIWNSSDTDMVVMVTRKASSAEIRQALSQILERSAPVKEMS